MLQDREEADDLGLPAAAGDTAIIFDHMMALCDVDDFLHPTLKVVGASLREAGAACKRQSKDA